VVCNGNQGAYSTKDYPIAATANHAKSSHKLSLVSIIAKRTKKKTEKVTKRCLQQTFNHTNYATNKGKVNYFDYGVSMVVC